MKRTLSAAIITCTALTLATLPARRSAAHDDSKDLEIKIVAPLEATNCTATPPTITVLGLSIDVSAAEINATGPSTATASPTPVPNIDDGGKRRHGSSPTSTTTNCYYNACTSPPAAPTPTGCAALILGQDVEVKFASDKLPLAAIEVKQDASDIHNVELQAPLQAFDTQAQTITVLGLTIDVSGAGLEGADDDTDDGHSQRIDLSHLMVGQSVEVVLASSNSPLLATEVEVKNFTNQLQVDVTDADGHSVNDVDDHGNPVDDVDVEVVQTIPVRDATGSPATAKVLHFHSGSNGGVVLRGLAATRAIIFVTRVHDGATFTSHHIVRVRPNSGRSVHTRLRSESSN